MWMGKHHNMYGTPTYKSWSEMKSRCNHPERATGHYEDVSYCDEWEDFRNFFKDMGIRPEHTSLDRIDPNGNYCPENCRWADFETQENNRRNNKKYLIDGNYLTLNQIARKYGISRSNLANKIYIYHMDMIAAIEYLTGRGEKNGGKKNVFNECD